MCVVQMRLTGQIKSQLNIACLSSRYNNYFNKDVCPAGVAKMSLLTFGIVNIENKFGHYNLRFVSCGESAPYTVCITGDRVSGDNIKQYPISKLINLN